MEQSTEDSLPTVPVTAALAEKSLESARGFLGRLITPLATEVGLLIADPIRIWRLRNQVAMLNKAKAICEKAGIHPKAISVKLIAPLLENASLEEDPELQNRWAILLANLVDSNQNIENHVFPYILGQISKKEFLVLDAANRARLVRIRQIQKELEIFLIQQPLLVKEVEEKLAAAKELQDREKQWNSEWFRLNATVRELGWQVESVKKWRESSFRSSLREPEVIQGDLLKEYELSNLVRLGLVKEVTETLPHSQTIDIPQPDDFGNKRVTVDLEVAIESNQYLILTQLGEIFLDACSLKNARTAPFFNG